LGSKRNLRSIFELAVRKKLDREITEPQEGRGAASGGIRAHIVYFCSGEQRKDIL
jgi:hypothetical protein